MESKQSIYVPRLKEFRNKKFLSQAELAVQAGISKPTIVRLETGKTGAHPSTVRKLAEALGVKPDELVG